MNGQSDLFNWTPAPSEQAQHLARVTGAIGESVMEFCQAVGVGGRFRAQQLHDFVGKRVAPASADRILRAMRQAGRVGYVIENRRASLYRITALG